jgi:O-antigen/teichoic acid export membrane protein
MTSGSQNSLVARLMRGAALTSGAFVLAQIIRFASNLIAARLLFPEAFGLMALVNMIIVGLIMLSDAGLQQAIMQHRRGDDPAFLNTAFTLNVARGGLLFALACALAWPAAELYTAPDLLVILPVCALTLIVNGLTPTRVFTAERHIRIGRLTLLELSAQAMSILLVVALAYATGSVWALVAGMVSQPVFKLVLIWLTLPGPRNRLMWERAAGMDLLRFGGWIMLSSAFGFLLLQGDKLILGYFFTLESLGVYNIAWFLASFPVLLTYTLIERLVIPVYRETFEEGSVAAARRLRRMRSILTGGVVLMLGFVALGGPWIIALLYDDRYAAGGLMIVLIACAQMPGMIIATYDRAALTRGDSQGFFRVTALRASLQTTLFLLGVMHFGLPGALAGQALAILLAYPSIRGLAIRSCAWDGVHDLGFGLLAFVLSAAALWLHADGIASLFP